jgi:hypothetical protein
MQRDPRRNAHNAALSSPVGAKTWGSDQGLRVRSGVIADAMVRICGPVDGR